MTQDHDALRKMAEAAKAEHAKTTQTQWYVQDGAPGMFGHSFAARTEAPGPGVDAIANANWIAHAHEQMPQLLDALEALMKENETIRMHLRDVVGKIDSGEFVPVDQLAEAKAAIEMWKEAEAKAYHEGQQQLAKARAEVERLKDQCVKLDRAYGEALLSAGGLAEAQKRIAELSARLEKEHKIATDRLMRLLDDDGKESIRDQLDFVVGWCSPQSAVQCDCHTKSPTWPVARDQYHLPECPWYYAEQYGNAALRLEQQLAEAKQAFSNSLEELITTQFKLGEAQRQVAELKAGT